LSPPVPVLHLRSSAEVAGPDRVLLDLLPALGRSGFPCELALLAESRTSAGSVAAAAAERGIGLVELPTHGPVDPGLLVRLSRLARDFALIHAHEPKSHLYGWVAARRAGRPLVATHHGWLGRDPRELLYERLDAQVLRRADRVICVSSPGAADLTGRWNVPVGAVCRVPNGIDPTRLARTSRRALCRRLGLRGDLPLIVAVGRLERGKGFGTLLQALHRLRQRGLDLQAAVLGRGGERDALLERAAGLGLEGRFALPGYLDDAPTALSGADLFVLASSHEQHPVCLLEAMAQAIPIVATRVGGVPQTLEHGVHGLLVEPDDPGEMGEAIAALLADPARAGELAATARRRVSREFGIERMARGYSAVYEDLLT